jgi:nucleotide-binding universal stress UspA family protein
LLEQAIAQGDDGDQPATERRVVQGNAAAVLIEQSRSADLLVVGNRGHGGFTGMLLGSVSGHCEHHAHCPVVVVRS